MTLLTLAALLAVAPAGAQPGGDRTDALVRVGEDWKRLLDGQYRATVAEGEPVGDPSACEPCSDAQAMLPFCHAVNVEEFGPTRVSAGDCKDSCETKLVGQWDYAKACAKRYADEKCREAMSKPEVVAELDKDVPGTERKLGLCPNCLAPVLWARRKEEQRQLRRSLDAALGAKAPAELRAAIKRVMARQSCKAPGPDCRWRD